MDKLLELEKKLIQVREELEKANNGMQLELKQKKPKKPGLTPEERKAQSERSRQKQEKRSAQTKMAQENWDKLYGAKKSIDDRLDDILEKAKVEDKRKIERKGISSASSAQTTEQEDPSAAMERAKNHKNVPDAPIIPEEPRKPINHKWKGDLSNVTVSKDKEGNSTAGRGTISNVDRLAAEKMRQHNSDKKTKVKPKVVVRKISDVKKSMSDRLDDVLEKLAKGHLDQKTIEEKMKDPEWRKQALEANKKITAPIVNQAKAQKQKIQSQNDAYDDAVETHDPDARPAVSQKKRSQTGIDQVNRRKEAPDRKLIAKEKKGIL